MANVSSLSDLNKKKEEEDDQNKYYVGGNAQGGGGSGLSVMGPPDQDQDGSHYSGIFAHAESGSSEDTPATVITLYRDGFTVDDGEYRPLSDPENKLFLDDLNLGRVPQELAHKGTDLSVSIVNKATEEYVPPAYVAYSGSGHSIGAAAAQDGAVVESTGVDLPVVDDSKPKTTIAVRLHTGKRMRASLNHSHTLRHLQALIQAEGAGEIPYILMAGFPPSQITNFDQTVEEAGLCGSQVTQKKA